MMWWLCIIVWFIIGSPTLIKLIDVKFVGSKSSAITIFLTYMLCGPLGWYFILTGIYFGVKAANEKNNPVQ